MPSSGNLPRAHTFEETALAAVLLSLGALGFVLGVVSPREHPTELVLGSGLFALGAWTFWRDDAKSS